jgi:hypothetical protein
MHVWSCAVQTTVTVEMYDEVPCKKESLWMILDHYNAEIHSPLFTSITELEKMLAKSYGIRHPGRFCSE